MVETASWRAGRRLAGIGASGVSSIEEFRARSMAGSPQSQPRPAANSLQVLVAEDDRILQKLYEHTLSSWGLPPQIRLVSSGIDGLLEIGRVPPDLLITDLRMPGIDGFEMIRRLRADPSSRSSTSWWSAASPRTRSSRTAACPGRHLLQQAGAFPRTEGLCPGQDHGHAAPRSSGLIVLSSRRPAFCRPFSFGRLSRPVCHCPPPFSGAPRMPLAEMSMTVRDIFRSVSVRCVIRTSKIFI
jgi:CheY-like chemotaxis protein